MRLFWWPPREPTSLTDAYSLFKVLSKYGYNCPVKVIINQVKSGKSAQSAYAQLKKTVTRFLPIRLEPLGILALDRNVRAAVISQIPFSCFSRRRLPQSVSGPLHRN